MVLFTAYFTPGYNVDDNKNPAEALVILSDGRFADEVRQSETF